MIADYLGRTDFLALCLTCKELRSVTEPLLYARLKWESNQLFNPPLHLLLRTLMRRPKLGKLIQTIDLDFREMIPNRRKGDRPKIRLGKVDVQDMVDWIKATGVPYSYKWIRGLRAGRMDAFVALLLCRAPRLRSLVLGRTYTCESSLFGPLFRSCLLESPKSNRLPSFKRLQNVTIPWIFPDVNESRQPRNTEEILTLLYLPSIKHINAKMCNPSTFAWPGTTPPDLSRLITLQLDIVREEHLGRVLSLTSNLERLEWSWFYRPDLEDEFVTDTVDYEKIAAALSHVSGTLVDLKISASSPSCVSYEPPSINLERPFHAFCDFDKLKRLEVPLVFLAGFSPSDENGATLEAALPRNVEWVTITDDMYDQEEWDWLDEDIFWHVEGWITRRMDSTIHLQELHLQMEDMDFRDWNEELTTAVRDLSLREKVVIDLKKFERSCSP